eukprot:6181744-Pleurochrysis_carterae.AAC.2
MCERVGAQRAAATYYAMPEVTTPLLKLYAELVYNKAQRLTFDSSSPNGILLFRDASSIVVSYGNAILKHQARAARALAADASGGRQRGSVRVCEGEGKADEGGGRRAEGEKQIGGVGGRGVERAQGSRSRPSDASLLELANCNTRAEGCASACMSALSACCDRSHA